MASLAEKNKKLVIVSWHVAAWLIVFSLPYLLRLIYDQEMMNRPESRGFLYLGLYTSVLWAISFYINAYIFFPLIINRKKWYLYVMAIAGLFFLLLQAHGFFFKTFLPNKPFNLGIAALFNAPAYLLSLAASTIFQLVQERREAARMQHIRQEENLKTELSFLRSQISPHFIFNVLNNIVALARLKSDKLEPTVLQLSSLMQYMLYDTNEDRVLLRSEIDYLRSYIELQQQRFGDKVKVTMNIDTKDDFYEIEPMLLIPFVENAFKHGVGLVQNPEINVDLSVKDRDLFFTVKNRYNNGINETKDKASGIGLHNVQRRLNLLYKDQHTLTISRHELPGDNKMFEINLQINLH